MNHPKVSICIPAFNQVKYLQRTIDSILAQKYTDYEIILTDDSPTDIVFDLVKKYATAAKIKYFKNATALNSPENWNEAMRKSTGSYIKIMHHDDWFTNENSLSEFVKMLDENPTIDFAFSATNVNNIQQNFEKYHCASEKRLELIISDPTILMEANWINCPSATIFRKDEQLFFDNSFKWVVDFEFYIRYIQKHKGIVFTKSPLVQVIALAKHNISNEFIGTNRNCERLLLEYFSVYDKIRKTTKNNKLLVAFLKSILLQQNVLSVYEIRKAGYKNKIPIAIFVHLYLIRFKKQHPLTMKYYRKGKKLIGFNQINNS